MERRMPTIEIPAKIVSYPERFRNAMASAQPIARRANHRRPNVLVQFVCQAPLAKIFCFTEYSEYPISLLSCPTKGALRNVNNAGRDAVDADGALDEGI
jgi:hypothetical protein